MLNEARGYVARGWSVIPVTQNKVPALRWKTYQERLPTDDELRSWFERDNGFNVAVVTGQVSNLCVLDVDEWTPEWVALVLRKGPLPDTFAVSTGKGDHFYFSGTGPSRVGVVPGVDVRGDGGYVVAPPSRHANGKVYEVSDDSPVHAWPRWLDDEFKSLQPQPTPSVPLRLSTQTTAYGSSALQGMLEDIGSLVPGQRNVGFRDKIHRLAGLVSGGEIAGTEEELAGPLIDAYLAVSDDSYHQARDTFHRAWEHGFARPLSKPEAEEVEDDEPFFTPISNWKGGSANQMWVWDQWLPGGELSVLSGQPKVGKGLIVSRIIGELTTGTLPGSYEGRPQRVLVSFTEDHYPTMVVPRLEAVGANLDNVFNIAPTRRDLTPSGLRSLESAIRSVDAVLVVFDQLSDHVPPGRDGWKNDSGYVRPIMLDVLNIAQRTGAGILGVLHDRKGQQTGVDGIEGSGAWGAVPRHLLRADGRRRSGSLAVVRSNVGGSPPAKEFRYEANKIEWRQDG